MSVPTFGLALRLRLRSTILAAAGMTAVIIMVGALFPAVGDSIGKLNVPSGVAGLLGGADYGTLTGWMRSEIGAVYGPLVVGATAITAAASTAGEEEAGTLALVLAHPVSRGRTIAAKTAAVVVVVAIVCAGTWIGLTAGVAVAGGGIGIGHVSALVVHLALFGVFLGALAMALAAATGSRAAALGGAAGYAVVGFLVNGFAPLVGAIEWLKYASPFYYYAGHDPLGSGLRVADLVVLGLSAAVLTGLACVAIRRRDLRG